MKAKETKVNAPKKQTNYRKVIKKWIAVPAAYIVLIATSAYGIKQMLSTLQEDVAIILTVLFVLALVYILFESE